MSDEALELLREIRDELREMRLATESRRAPSLRLKDREMLARILPVIAENLDGVRFGVWEIVDIAKTRSAAGLNLRLVLGDLSAQKLGLLFRRGVGRDIDGLRLVRSGQNGNGALWACKGTGVALERPSAASQKRTK